MFVKFISTFFEAVIVSLLLGSLIKHFIPLCFCILLNKHPSHKVVFVSTTPNKFSIVLIVEPQLLGTTSFKPSICQTFYEML